MTPDTATEIASASRIVTEAMEALITFGNGSSEQIKAAAREIDASQGRPATLSERAPVWSGVSR